MWLAGATRYTNRYRNGWAASAAVARQALDDARRPGRKQKPAAAVPYADMPQPVPVSRFQWPQPQARVTSRVSAALYACSLYVGSKLLLPLLL